MNEVEVISVFTNSDSWSLNHSINNILKFYSEDDYRLINVQVVSDKLTYVTLQSKY